MECLCEHYSGTDSIWIWILLWRLGQWLRLAVQKCLHVPMSSSFEALFLRSTQPEKDTLFNVPRSAAGGRRVRFTHQTVFSVRCSGHGNQFKPVMKLQLSHLHALNCGEHAESHKSLQCSLNGEANSSIVTSTDVHKNVVASTSWNVRVSTELFACLLILVCMKFCLSGESNFAALSDLYNSHTCAHTHAQEEKMCCFVFFVKRGSLKLEQRGTIPVFEQPFICLQPDSSTLFEEMCLPIVNRCESFLCSKLRLFSLMYARIHRWRQCNASLLGRFGVFLYSRFVHLTKSPFPSLHVQGELLNEFHQGWNELLWSNNIPGEPDFIWRVCVWKWWECWMVAWLNSPRRNRSCEVGLLRGDGNCSVSDTTLDNRR